MKTDLPVLNLTCLNNPSGRCILVAESCVNCRNRNILIAHAAAHHEKAIVYRDLLEKSTTNSDVHKYTTLTQQKIDARAAVLALAGKKTIEELEGMKDGN